MYVIESICLNCLCRNFPYLTFLVTLNPAPQMASQALKALQSPQVETRNRNFFLFCFKLNDVFSKTSQIVKGVGTYNLL
jgi:hypothetical protein